MEKQEMIEKAVREVGYYTEEIGNVVLSLLEKINNNYLPEEAWEFKSIENLSIYIKGAAKKGLIKNQWNKQAPLTDEIMDNTADPYDSRKMELKFIFDKVEAQLEKINPLNAQIYQMYFVDQLPQRDIAEKVGMSQVAVLKRIRKINAWVTENYSMEAYNDTPSAFGIHFEGGKNSTPQTDIVTPLSLLKSYRRTGNPKRLEKYRLESESAITRHESKGCQARVYNPIGMSCQLPIEYAPVWRTSPDAWQHAQHTGLGAGHSSQWIMDDDTSHLDADAIE